ncbi:MAG: glycosyltransferase [Betaproteobacteria bacterium]|nr:glycosyltransferase [Betaproteobacteria bacterium]
MRVLVLCDRIPSSYRDGLTLRVLHYVRRLGAMHTFDLLCFRAAEETEEIHRLFDRVWLFDKPGSTGPSASLSAVRGWSPEALYPFSPEMRAFLATKLRADDYDLVWDAGCCMAAHLPAEWQDVPYFADLVDEMVLTLVRELRHCRSLTHAARLLKYLYLNVRFERKYLGKAALCTVVSDADATMLRRVVGHDRVVTIQNGVDIDYFSPADSPPVPRQIVFEGSMAFTPNIDAARYLVNEILPLIRKAMPDVTLKLVGRDPDPSVLALSGDSVEVTGSVPDVRPYIASSAVFVCPLRFGAGIKNKILQAWAMGKPIVATPVSVKGLPVTEGTNILVRDDAESIAAAVVDLLNAPGTARALGAAGRETVTKSFSWEAKAREIEKAFHDACLGHRNDQEVLTT